MIYLIRSISIQDFLKINFNINLIDIRSVQKYNDNHIPNAINISKELLVKEYTKYLDKNLIYYIYCQMGEQSIKVCRLLTQLGYKVINISGGYESWLLSN